MSSRINRPSPALVISVVALFVSLGGTGYATTQLAKNSVGAKHLKKNAVSSAKVKNSSLQLGDFRASERSKLRGAAGATGARGAAGARGSQGLQGAQGVQGVQGSQGAQGSQGDPGAQGDPGPQGATGVEQVVVRSTALVFTGGSGPNGQQLSDDVQCQAGESVVGGGTDINPVIAVTDQPNVIVNSTRPADASGASVVNGDEPTGWFASARRNSNAGSHTVTVYVLCASEGA